MWTRLVAVIGTCALLVDGARVNARREQWGEPAIAWQIPGDARGRPDVDEHSAYFLSRGDEVVAIGDLRGRVRWRAPLGPRLSEASAAGPRVVVAGPVVVAGGADLVAFDRATGQKRWQLAPAADYGLGFYIGDAAAPDLTAGSTTGGLFAVDAATGAVRWRARVGGTRTTVHAPVVEGDDVAAAFRDLEPGGLGGVVVVDRVSGKERWRATLPRSDRLPDGAVAGGPVIGPDELFVTAHDGTVYSLARADGIVRWFSPAIRSPDYRPVAVAGRRLLVGSLQGDISALDADTGRELWRTRPIWASVAFEVVAVGGLLYVPYLSGDLLVLDIENGRTVWRSSVGDTFRWSPKVVGSRMYLASASTGFLKFDWSQERDRGGVTRWE
jgi:outer membrane protein assembly factor BamB